MSDKKFKFKFDVITLVKIADVSPQFPAQTLTIRIITLCRFLPTHPTAGRNQAKTNLTIPVLQHPAVNDSKNVPPCPRTLNTQVSNLIYPLETSLNKWICSKIPALALLKQFKQRRQLFMCRS